ncbi:multiple sugar transport system permease protein [Clostridium saccharoperbutylacetonicum]|uniref:ABC-type sugar transport system, permease component n=1 Tax=Clostridium saccharoperbutylacetonicum N1-4(HMT) TaxID=931276 RepID=M1MM67_9CLOT|nr:carbohydrate ABC transporter permease [Clostridium saccharoperbutylacetonicum]AGF59024.1 ABC-type sugar transport system, permease component [Clostridium saccharoperbutylacetonicum N1-4(HMT)]NRT60188.1 multiple sugar transport system permease protein [Clostridium saccharoperbutylacetonicum]NSB23500.1 multiple sugar transport system permease protein [Clostridium saccharoperbutylacetonicum]NSB42870.1 multiple sugar transport system permease protein [Clostridium saccharoperbutylacetonicum]
MSKRKLNRKEIAYETVKYAVLIFFLLVFIIPILSVFFAAFKTSTEYSSTNALQLPKSFLNFDNFKVVFNQGNMLNGFKNTLIVLVFSLLGSVLTGSMAAYIFSRFKTKFSKFVNGMFLVAVMIPGIATQVATFQIVSGLGLFNTRLAPIILYCGTDIMSIYIFLQFLENISVSLDESAIIDGANYFQIFYKIILPLLSPAIITVLITKGVGVYNDFYTPFLYTPKAELLTISTTLFKFKGPYGAHWEIIAAGMVLIMIPTFLVFITLQKYIYSGLVSGSVKE